MVSYAASAGRDLMEAAGELRLFESTECPLGREMRGLTKYDPVGPVYETIVYRVRGCACMARSLHKEGCTF